MIFPFLIFYVLPLLFEVPWLATGSYLFFVTLHGLSRVRLFSNTTYDFLPREVANRLRTYTAEQERNYFRWCVSGVVVAGSIAVLAIALPDVTLVQRMSTSALVSVALALFYAPLYHNKKELLGDWSWRALRRSRLWVPFHGYFNFTPVYMHEAPPDLPSRDERRQTMKARKLGKDRIRYEMTTTDTRAFLAARFEPTRFFTFSRSRYEEVVAGKRSRFGETSGPQARRPRVYAAHPHGISTITAVFGALMYGPEPMLPEADNVRVAVADILFYIPVLRECALLCGCISAAPEAISHNLSRSRDVFLLPGGMMEQAMADFRSVEMVWNRFGFCRIAYHHQASIVPICAFGENETYMVFNWWPALRLRNYRRFGYAFPWIFLGPLPANVTPVVGLPIDTTYAPTTDASRRRAQRYLDRRGATHPQQAHPDDSDGDTPLVDLQHVSRTLTDGVAEVRRYVSDYYGTGYKFEDAAMMRSGQWNVDRLGEIFGDEEDDDDEDEEEGSYVTLIDTQLDQNNMIESSFVADLQRAFYAQFVDLRDSASVALPQILPDIAYEKWGETLTDLKARLNRTGNVRQF